MAQYSNDSHQPDYTLVNGRSLMARQGKTLRHQNCTSATISRPYWRGFDTLTSCLKSCSSPVQKREKYCRYTVDLS